MKSGISNYGITMSAFVIDRVLCFNNYCSCGDFYFFSEQTYSNVVQLLLIISIAFKQVLTIPVHSLNFASNHCLARLNQK